MQKIYCIGILANNILSEISGYHNIAVLKNQKDELIDDQMTFVAVELAKFDKEVEAIETDLDKLIYTMKNLHKVTDQTKFPKFWNEKWLKKAIQELDTKAMTPEQRLAYEMTISANALAIKNEAKKINQVKVQAIKKALESGKLTIEDIANFNDVSTNFVLDVQNQLLGI